MRIRSLTSPSAKGLAPSEVLLDSAKGLAPITNFIRDSAKGLVRIKKRIRNFFQNNIYYCMHFQRPLLLPCPFPLSEVCRTPSCASWTSHAPSPETTCARRPPGLLAPCTPLTLQLRALSLSITTRLSPSGTPSSRPYALGGTLSAHRPL